MATLEKYGRGTDISFQVDSFVLIAYRPPRKDVARQMLGRSSRRMGGHVGKVLFIDKLLATERDVEDHLDGSNFAFIKDGIEIA